LLDFQKKILPVGLGFGLIRRVAILHPPDRKTPHPIVGVRTNKNSPTFNPKAIRVLRQVNALSHIFLLLPATNFCCEGIEKISLD
jgi:hypothetical protein